MGRADGERGDPAHLVEALGQKGRGCGGAHATGLPFTRATTGGTLGDCSASAQVTTVYSTNTSFANGGSTANPLSTATVKSCYPFHTLFAYPFLTTNGAWVVKSERQITILVGR